MGIVVTLAMLFGLIVLRPTPWRDENAKVQNPGFVTFTITALTVFGLWNFLWYGLRHLGDFWGWAAIVSGASMVAAALIVFVERESSSDSSNSRLIAARSPVIGVLAISFLLYAITLVQLNMGLPIIG